VGVLDSLDFTSALAGHMAGDVLWAYLLLALTTAPPLVPNSALLVTGGVLAERGQLNIAFVLLAVAGSALAGDLIMHRAGRVVSGPVLGRFHRRPGRRQLLEWAAGRIERYGVPFVVACRFLPSGRLVGAMAAGIIGYPARRYAVGAGIAEVLWATYSVGIGYLGGRATGDPVRAVAVGLGVSLAVASIGGLMQIAARRQGARAPVASDPAPASPLTASPLAAASPAAAPVSGDAGSRTVSAPPV
jgi:membrane protein DedA with SNARE-associated domain